jgi:hypothetical protein
MHLADIYYERSQDGTYSTLMDAYQAIEAYAELIEKMIENWSPHRSVKWSRGPSPSSA